MSKAAIAPEKSYRFRVIFGLEERFKHKMSIRASVQNLACILGKHTKETSLINAMHLYAYVRRSGLELHRSVGNYLVVMFVEAGSLWNAWNISDRLVDMNECSWNALMRGHIRCGEAGRTLALYQKMQEACIQPNRYTFIALIKACAELRDVEKGREMHGQVVLKGWLESDLFIGNSLVDMYAKCGLLATAEDVLNRLSFRDVVSWNSLIAGFAKHENSQEVWKSIQKMQLEGISPDAVTYVCSLNVCGCDRSRDKGLELHAVITRRGLLETNNIVGNALVDMYAKCGLLLEAQNVFDSLPMRDVVTWNALISGYAIFGFNNEALRCFDQMQLIGVSPNAVSFVCSLQACANAEATDKAKEIHAEICRKDLLKKNLFVGNALVGVYAQCGLFAQAQQVFDNLPIRNVVSWTALIAGYANCELGEEALDCFDQMELDGVSPNAVTYICSLKACGSVGATAKGIYIHSEIARQGFLETDLVVCNALVDMYANCGLLEKAQEVFDNLHDRDVILWTALISGYTKHECGEKALECFEQMQLEGFSPNAITYVCSLTACGMLSASDKGKQIHAEIDTQELLQKDIFVGNALIDMYAKCGLLAIAQEVFDNLPLHDVVSWTALMAGYANHKLGEEALSCFEKMRLEGFPPNAATYICSLKACSVIGATEKGREIHDELACKGFLERNLLIGNALVDMYVKCGLLTKAQEVFYQLPVRDVVSWTALVAGYIQLGESDNFFQVFESMKREGTNPDLVAFVGVLSACSHTGLVDKGRDLFESMTREYGLRPTLEHHTCIADLFSRAGHLEEAFNVIEKIPFHPDLVLVRTVLDACRKWGNLEIGRKVFEHAVHLDERDASAYVCLSKIYAGITALEGAYKDQYCD